MPPRKSDSSKVATGDESSVLGTAAGASTATKKDDGVNIEDLNLPKSIVTRLAKGVLPPNTQIQGNAMLALSKSATVFVNYLATNANEYAQNANRKTIAPADVFKALDDIEFDFKDRLEAELAKFNEIQTDKRNTYRKKVAADKATGPKSGSPVGGDGEPAAKKPRIDADADAEGAANEVEDASDLLDEGDLGEEIAEEGEGEDEQDGEDMEDEEAAEDVDEPTEDALEVPEERDVGDEALDNGEDSD